MNRDHILLLWPCLFLALFGTAAAQDRGKGRPAPASVEKQMSGMSIVGNDEAPTSLYIVPWKRSEIGAEATMRRMLTERADPVDREEFVRQLDLYERSAGK